MCPGTLRLWFRFVLGFFQGRKAEADVWALQPLSTPSCRVPGDGAEQVVPNPCHPRYPGAGPGAAGAVHAAHRAALVSKETGAALELFHSTNLFGLDRLRRLVPGVPEGLEQQAIDAGREQLAELGRRLHEVHGIAAGLHIALGDAFAEIEARAAALPADLVVLGAHGNSALPRLVMGSTAVRMAAASRCPVLMVSDAAGLARHSARLLALRGEALPQNPEQERVRKCDLIIMGRRGEVPLLEQVFLGSVTKQVLAQSRADVLVAKGE